SVVELERPSWENNLNADMDGNESLWTSALATQSSQRYERSVRLTAANGRIRTLSIGDSQHPTIESSGSGLSEFGLAPLPIMALGMALIWSLRPSSGCQRSTQRGRLITGLRQHLVVPRAQLPPPATLVPQDGPAITDR